MKPLYAEVYAEPPYHEGPEDVAEFVDRWNHHTQQRGFRIVLAHDRGGELVGFTFGFTLPENSRWWDGLLDPVDPDITREDGHRTFAVIELAVTTAHRRHGIGAALHHRLLTGRTEERATLLTRPEAAPALAAYTQWEYQPVGQLRPGEGAPVYLAMLRDLS